MAFDIEGARKAGYSDAEIADHLASQSKFDTAGARQSGYSDTEIIQHLSSAPAATPADPYAGMSFLDKARNDIKLIASGAKRIGTLSAKSANDTIAQTLLLPANATTQAINKVAGRNDPTLGERYQKFSDADVAPARNIPEKLLSAAVSAYTGFKIPMPFEDRAPAQPQSSLQETIGQAREAGYKVLPSNVKATPTRRAVEAIVGRKELAADITQSNVARVAENIADELRLPKGTEINQSTLEAVISDAGTAYDDIAKLSPGYSDAVQTVKELRNTANKYFRQSATNYSVEAEDKAMNAWNSAKKIDDLMAQSLKSQGQGELFESYQAARTTIAKAYDVMKALVKSTGELKASTFAKGFTKGKPQSGAILAAGRTAEAFPKEFSTPMGSPWKGLDQFLVGSGVGAEVLFHNPKYAAGLILGGLGRGLARKGLASDAYQNYLLLSGAQKQAALAESTLRAGVAANSLKDR